MRDGEGDHILILFRQDGCVINGFAHEFEQQDKQKLTQNLPSIFGHCMMKMVVGLQRTQIYRAIAPVATGFSQIAENATSATTRGINNKNLRKSVQFALSVFA